MSGGLKKITSVTLCLFLTAAMTACGAETETALTAVEETAPADQETQEDTVKEQGPVVSAPLISSDTYEGYVAQTPGIVVDLNGYDTTDDKVAVFSGDVLPTSYEVRRNDTDEVVFTGEVSRFRDDETLGTGDFSALDAEGEYYLRSEWMGESYTFEIKENSYSVLSDQVMRRYYLNRCGFALTQEYAGEDAHGVCHSAEATIAGDESGATIDVTGGWHMDEMADRFTADGAEIVSALLLAYETDPEAFGDDGGIPESGNGVPDILDECLIEVNWLLKMQDQRTGGVYSAVLTKGGEGSMLLAAPVELTAATPEASAAAAAALAKFSYNYRKVDPELATTALRAADRALSWYLRAEGDELGDLAFAAAAELYRATGRESYAEILNDFFVSKDFFERVMDETPLFTGAVTYLTTTGQPVEKSYSGKLMDALRLAAEKIAERSNGSVYGADIKDGQDPSAIAGALLSDLKVLAVNNRVSYSYEYARLIKRYIHALCGRNPGSRDYLKGFEGDAENEGYPGVLNQPVENAAFMAALCGVSGDGTR